MIVSLSCQNCPDVVQALNAMAVINPKIRTVAIDGALYQGEVEKRQIMAVPTTTYLNGEVFAQGRTSVEEILARLDGNAGAPGSTDEASALHEVRLASGAVLRSKSVILATGARWREINVPGEREYRNRGVAYCPHCDGPLFKGKRVAVIGGGNSGVEAAIDLAGLVSHVTLVEFAPELRGAVQADRYCRGRWRQGRAQRLDLLIRSSAPVGADEAVAVAA